MLLFSILCCRTCPRSQEKALHDFCPWWAKTSRKQRGNDFQSRPLQLTHFSGAWWGSVCVDKKGKAALLCLTLVAIFTLEVRSCSQCSGYWSGCLGPQFRTGVTRFPCTRDSPQGMHNTYHTQEHILCLWLKCWYKCNCFISEYSGRFRLLL